MGLWRERWNLFYIKRKGSGEVWGIEGSSRSRLRCEVVVWDLGVLSGI
jgi:hypothetical protein